MLKLHKIKITNFRSYLGTHEFEFPVASGLYFLTGRNLVEPALGSNGSGKSTLLDAITWVLFGRTTRGLKANEVISWGASSCIVALELTVGTERVQIKRTQKPNGLFLDGKPLDQEELQKHIRLNYDSFLYSVINTQFGKSFLSLSPSEKLTLFSDIMNLDYWLTQSNKAAIQAIDYERSIKILEASINNGLGQAKVIEEDIKLYRIYDARFEAENEAKIRSVEQQIASFKGPSKQSAQLIASLRLAAAQCERERDGMLDNIVKTSRKRSEHKGKLDYVRGQIKSNSSLKGECPTCKQPVSQDAIERCKYKLVREGVELEILISSCEFDLVSFNKTLVRYKNKMDVAIANLNEALDKETEAKAQAKELARLQAKLVELEDNINPYIGWIHGKSQKLNTLKETIKRDTDDKARVEEQHAATSYWVKGFKRIRLFIIEQAFRTLELEINNSLAQLGMLDWQITFDIERENKSGGVTKGFVTFVKGPNNVEPVRWENWSGGEAQRLQLAGDLGLANLIMEQNGLSNTIEMYDEPSTHLSPEGMLDLAKMLHERAVTEGKQIWIADHASITNFGAFKGVITVEKTDAGSSITTSF